MDETYIVKPVYKAMQLLRAVGEAGRDLSLGEVCGLTGLPKSTAFKYLRTLRETGFIAHDQKTDTYRIGLLIWHLGQVSGEQRMVRDTVLPFMRDLQARFNETVNLGILDGNDIVYLEMVESSRALRMRAALGGRDPVYCTGLGKAILAHLPAESWRGHLPARMVPRTSKTITSVTALRDDLNEARERGWAIDRGENEEGVSCIAAPILGAGGRVAGALSVSAPAHRISRTLENDVAAAVSAAALEASERLGYSRTDRPVPQ